LDFQARESRPNFLFRSGPPNYSHRVKKSPANPALINPFPLGRDERHGLYFVSVHSYIVSATDWSGVRRYQYWVLDTASEWPMHVRVSGKEVVRPPGSVALYAPNVAYEEFLEKGNVVRMSWLMFRVRDRRSPLWKLVKPDGYRLFEDPGSLVRTLVRQIASCFLNPNAGADWFAGGAFYQILALLRSARGEPIRHIRLPNLRLRREESSLRSQVENYLSAHPSGRVAAAEMAGHLRLSLSSFTHRYHEEAGETFIQTKTRVRIERAKPLLLSSNWPIKQIAQELGFADAAHFSRVFRRVVGMSPVMFVRQVTPLTRPSP